jgi:hypothetical protein
MTGLDAWTSAAMAAELAAAISASTANWALDTVEVSIYGEARGNWQLYDWPTDSPHHWRALLSSRIGPAGAHLHAIELREQGETGILAVMRVAHGEAAAVCRALQTRYPDLTFAMARPF